MSDPKSQREIAVFQHFAALLGLSVGTVSNPNATGPETGMDVVTALDGKCIGVQLTDYHADEDRTAINEMSGRQAKADSERKA
jgi:hypothetical protein